MEVPPSAEALLSDIPIESLRQLLTTVQHDTSPPLITHIPTLDTYFSSRRPQTSLRIGDVMEIQGPAASGKSHLLSHIIITCITPTQHESRAIGGWDKAAIVIDSDHTFNLERFHQLLLTRLLRLLGHADQSDACGTVPDMAIVAGIASRCLSRLHIFRPDTGIQLAATLLRLPQYHASLPELQTTEIGLLAIDSVGAFYWQDRFRMERLRGTREPSGVGADPVSSLEHVLCALQSFRESHGPLIVLTNWGLNPLTKSSVHVGESLYPFYKQHLHPFPSPFESAYVAGKAIDRTDHTRVSDSLVNPATAPPASQGTASAVTGRNLRREHRVLPLTHHITLRPAAVAPLSTDSTIAEALQGNIARSIIVKKGEVQGFVRSPGSAAVGKFSFFITSEELLAHHQLD
ncbi:predicted protein [Postia placenta Mad-698-R]|uniref:DNA recombination and repair protein Rad51-like C-terminal domain-containing protein n=1 Tax=Postia placenta MAD-698-R-SB12 TaxID=670580 RepID=A0A1X6NGC8_9APHY|nr:hypothetical protein POSPLADRAFT_1127527 [Postia placenta MAD-698-R-SB12]EED82378.1 predicted protein [Postia placenta Mad-698-R]OSX67393.1 hypothetical protein POSPLADRAFT_1127527 [Postia placenta MAD-698-R-SB12]